MPRLTRPCTAMCSLVVALALFTLATTARKYSQHLLSHHPLRHPQQQHNEHQEQDHSQLHHRHEPTLAGALFPVADEILAGKDYVKEPCPTACVHHRSDVYLAVTSIGEGFPRVQFTCSHAHHAQPTGTAQQSHNQYPYVQESKSNVNKQEPAYPIPEHTPHAPAQGCDKCSQHEAHDRTDGASIYTDLHITANPHLRGSAPINDNNNAAGFQPYYVIVSPQERQSVDLDDDSETHTTTMTFSDDNSNNSDNNHRHHDTTRSVPLTSDQEPHNRVHILPVRDRYDHHVVPSGSFFKAAGGSGATTPEPIATLAAPTSLGSGSRQGQGHGWGDDRMVSREGDSAAERRALRSHEYRAGPAAPTPEPFPAQDKGHTHTDYHHHQGREDIKERAGQGHSHGQGKNPAVRHRTVVHRVTTLIIETETIVNRPMPTATASVAFMQGSKETQHNHNNNIHNNNNNNNKEQDNYRHHLHDRRDPHFYGPHAGDHIMFDAGVDGDMVVSIASSEKQSSRNKAAAH